MVIVDISSLVPCLRCTKERIVHIHSPTPPQKPRAHFILLLMNSNLDPPSGLQADLRQKMYLRNTFVTSRSCLKSGSEFLKKEWTNFAY